MSFKSRRRNGRQIHAKPRVTRLEVEHLEPRVMLATDIGFADLYGLPGR